MIRRPCVFVRNWVCVCWLISIWYVICSMCTLYNFTHTGILKLKQCKRTHMNRVLYTLSVNYDFRVYSCMIILFSFCFSTLSSLREIDLHFHHHPSNFLLGCITLFLACICFFHCWNFSTLHYTGLLVVWMLLLNNNKKS